MDSKKTEKLVTAIYLLTGFFAEREPMKWRLRELGNRLIVEAEKGHLVSEVLSLLTVAKHAGLVSDMNFDIIHREFSRLLPDGARLENVFSDLEKIPAPRPTVQEQAEIKPEAEMYIASSVANASNGAPGQTLSHAELGREEAPKRVEYLPTVSEHTRMSVIKDNSLPTREREPKPLKEFGVVAVKKNSRQSTIINLLKRKKEIMIKDVSPLIEGVSEKTIQRELLGMVKAGILRKQGEKRWSRYSLAD